MPRQFTRDRATRAVELKPIAGGGLNLTADPAMLSRDEMAWARNVDTTRRTFARRRGAAKIALLADQFAASGAKVFAADTKYARFTPPLIGKGGFALHFSFTAVRPVSGFRYLWSNWVSHADFEDIGVLWATISTVGNFVVLVNWQGGSAIPLSITAPGLTANATYHALVVYDAILGTLTLYLNGDVAAAPVAVGTGLQPRQDAGVAWYVGASYDPTIGVAASSGFGGAFDSFWLRSLAGIDINDEDLTALPPRRSLLTEMRARSFEDWRNPSDCLFSYGLDEATAGTGPMYDASDAQNHGVYFGSPANANRIAVRGQNGNWLGTTRLATVGALEDGTVNMACAGGSVWAERINQGS